MNNNAVGKFLELIQPCLEQLINFADVLESATKLKGIEFNFHHNDNFYKVKISSSEISIKRGGDNG